jgi:hypothetical protein
MEALKISENDLEATKISKAQEHFERIQEIVDTSNIDNTPPSGDGDGKKGETTEKSGVQMLFNYFITFLVFGWLFFLISVVLAFPGTRILYEVFTSKYNHMRTFLIFVIYSIYLSANPYVPFLQMVYTMSIFMFFESIDWWGLVTLNPAKTRPITTPLFWDEGMQSIFTSNGFDLGVKNTIEQVNNLDFTFEQMNTLLGEVDFITETVNTLKNATINSIQQGNELNQSNFFVQAEYLNPVAEVAENIAKMREFTFTRGDALDSVLNSNGFILKYGPDGSPFKQALHDAAAVKINYTAPTPADPNSRSIKFVMKEEVKANPTVTKNREEVLKMFDGMGIRRKSVNTSMYVFFIVAAIILGSSYYLLSYDKPMFRMEKIAEIGMDLKEKPANPEKKKDN